MSEKITQESVIQNKKKAIRSINALLENYIKSDNEKLLKKANLLAYWIKAYTDYIKKENEFDPQKIISYKRGDVIKLNFGFNIGAEYGGLHYAVVLDNNNDHNSPLVTVIPLKSGEEEDAYRTDVYLGDELYNKVQSRQEELLISVRKKMEDNTRLICQTEQMADDLMAAISNKKDKSSEIKPKVKELYKKADELNKMKKLYREEEEKLEKVMHELGKMKSGSIALMKQITTVNKMRIFVPKKSSDALYKVSLSEVNMEKINNRLKELYVFGS